MFFFNFIWGYSRSWNTPGQKLNTPLSHGCTVWLRHLFIIFAKAICPTCPHVSCRIETWERWKGKLARQWKLFNWIGFALVRCDPVWSSFELFMVHRFFFLCINVLGDFQLCHISIKAWTCLLKLWTDYIALTPIDLSEKDSMEFYTLAKKKKKWWWIGIGVYTKSTPCDRSSYIFFYHRELANLMIQLGKLELR